MRKLAILIWLLIPVAAGAYHYGPGQRDLKLDQADLYIAAAESAVAQGVWADAVTNYQKALENIPESMTLETYQLRLELNKARLQDKGLADAYQDLEILVEELAADSSASPELLADARATMANSQYYMTWLKRLEGLPADEWQPDIESARQTYALLAEQAVASGNTSALEQNKKDLEATIRLARMDLGELQGLPLPKCCQGCCSCKCKKPSMKVGKKKPEDARGASSGPPPDGEGS
jgi:tetratricopeptide (TPR) repeat protein